MRRLDNKRAFTLIELLVVIAVLGVLVLLAAPRFIGKTQSAFETSIIHDARLVQDATERYYLDNGEFPFRYETEGGERVRVEAGTPSEYEILHKVENFDNDNPNVKMYEIDFRELGEYVKINTDEGYFLAARGNPEFGITVLKPGVKSTQERLSKKESPAEDLDDTESKEDGLTTWYGLGPEAFDGDHDSSVRIYKDKDYFVTWDGDMTNNIVSVILANGGAGGWSTSISMKILDEENKELDFVNAGTGQIVKSLSISHHNKHEKKSFDFIVPQGAERLKFTSEYPNSYNAPGHVYEIISYENKQLPSPVKNVKLLTTYNSVMLNWEDPESEGFDKVAIYRDNEFIGFSNKGSFEDYPLYSDKDYVYSLYSINKTGNRSHEVKVEAKTQVNGTVWRGLNPSVFNGETETYQSISSKGSAYATWEGELAGEDFTVVMSRMNASGWDTSITMTILDKSGARLNFTNKESGQTVSQLRSSGRGTSKETFNFTMPNNAYRIKFESGSYASSRVYMLSDLK